MYVFLFFLFPGHQLAYWLGPFGKSFCLSFTVDFFLLGLFSFYLDQIPFAEVSV